MKRYRIISELGKGATGVVFRAVRSEDGSTVALKKLVLPGHLDAREEEEFVKRFKVEAKAAEVLNHPGIVKALDCGLDEGTLYIAYELIEGVTMEDAVKSGRKFAPDEIADIIAQASEALEHAHQQGIVHRDLSPGNIFLTNEGKVRITDFGVAGFTSKATLTSGSESIVGTPGYMAPEQITGGEADPRSDIFSLGCVAYELLTGKSPFGGQNLAQIVHRVINEQPSPIRETDPRVPVSLEEIVFRMLAKNPDYRYQSMKEVHTAAQRVLAEVPRMTRGSKPGEAVHAPILAVVEGPHKGEEYDLLPTVSTIGRTVGDVLLSRDPLVSQQHAWVTREETGWVLYDADTESGTLLNGERIEREEIFAGDRIRLGDTVLEFRGAGGHVGPFVDKAEVSEAGKQALAIAGGKRIQWPLVVVLAIPGILVLAALVVFGLVIPHNYMAKLDAATNDRWDSAFGRLDSATIGTPAWLQDASDVLTEWRGNPLFDKSVSPDSTRGGPSDFMAPVWIIGSGRINREVIYRFDLFNLAEEFVAAVTNVPSNTDTSGSPEVVPPSLLAVREIEQKVTGLKVPAGATQAWGGRRNQLLSVVKRWLATSVTTRGRTGPSGFAAERESAKAALLNGWYAYEAAGSQLPLLSDAFGQFQTCIETLTPVLDSQAGDKDALAVRGLAYYLGAEVLREAGDQLGQERYQRAIVFLDNAQADLATVNQDIWDRAIPGDFKQQFQSPASVLAQVRALRLVLDGLVQSQ